MASTCIWSQTMPPDLLRSEGDADLIHSPAVDGQGTIRDLVMPLLQPTQPVEDDLPIVVVGDAAFAALPAIGTGTTLSKAMPEIETGLEGVL